MNIAEFPLTAVTGVKECSYRIKLSLVTCTASWSLIFCHENVSVCV